MVQCEECDMWCLVYSKYKLTKAEFTELSTAMNDYTYTCGASLLDLCLPGRLKDVAIWMLRSIRVETILFNKEPNWFYCCRETDVVVTEGFYPQCSGCKDRLAIKRWV